MALIKNEKVITGTVDGGSITHTEKLPHKVGFAVQATYSGTGISGSAKLQASLNGTDFVDVEDSEVTFTDNSGNFLWDNNNINYNYLKIVLTSASGAIKFDAWLAIKRPKPTA